jgi:hypothetical protein
MGTLVSNCCGAKIIPNFTEPICSMCYEHCDVENEDLF